MAAALVRCCAPEYSTCTATPLNSVCVSLQVNEFVKRVRAFRIHLLIMGHIKQAMPALFGKDKAAKKMLQHLPDIFRQVRWVTAAACSGLTGAWQPGWTHWLAIMIAVLLLLVQLSCWYLSSSL